jgi:N-acetylglucosamine-6-phosphate deacetylase
VQQIYSTKILCSGNEVLTNQVVVVEAGKVTSISSANANKVPADFEGHYLVPAFVDLQIYGARGKLFSMYPTVETLQEMYAHCKSGGTAGFMVTVATNAEEVIRQCIDAVREYWRCGGEGLLGLHLEGPWINPIKRGAHLEEHIKAPQVEDVLPILEYGRGVVKFITVAPEVCSDEIFDLIRSYGIVISAGHSNATFDEASRSFSHGITAVTHMYNAMSTLHHRDTGLPGAAFTHDKVVASIIVDGHHVDFNAVKIAKKQRGNRLFLITDAVTETTEGPYQHTFFEGRYICGDTLSGSSLTMLEAVKNCVLHCGISAEEAFRMASFYPAQLISIRAGTLAINEVASFLLLDAELNPVAISI